MKVKATVTLDIDVDSYVLNYGVEKKDIREDVQNYVRGLVLDHFHELDLLVTP